MSNWQAIIDNQPSERNALQIKTWLEHFGYLTGNILSGAVSPEQAVATFEAAVSRAQLAVGLPATGRLDKPTVSLINQPRCGCLDVAREIIGYSRWRKTSLTYRVDQYMTGLGQGEIDEILEAAWQAWEKVAGVKITRVTSGSMADIIVNTGRGRADGFDGPSGILAYAYMPTGNDAPLLMRFDADETWVHDNPNAGILLQNVACHEFGHLLGLDHSQNPKALMAPYYSPQIVVPQAVDDIPRIQALYGPATSSPPPVPVPPPSGNKFSLTLTAPGVIFTPATVVVTTN